MMVKKGYKPTIEHRKNIAKALKDRQISEVQKEKISETLKKKFREGKLIAYWKNKSFSLEHRKNLSKSHKGKKLTFEHKQSISKSMKGQISWNKGLTKEIDMRVKRIGEKNKGKTSHRKNLTLQQEYGKEKAKIINKKLVESHMNKKANDLTRRRMRESALNNIETRRFNSEPLTPAMGKYETSILNNLEQCFGYIIERQKRVAGYFLDGYCSMLRLAIEIDEPYHFNSDGELREKDIRRQKEIEEEMGYTFLRIDLRGAL